MFCKNCGTQINNDGSFCSKCGTNSKSDAQNTTLNQTGMSATASISEIKCSNCGYEGSGKKGRRVVSQILIWLTLPFFWPAILLYYLITKKYLCPKCGSDFLGIKNKQGVYNAQRSGTSPIAWVFMILIIIAVIGILASVVLASLNSAREKVLDAEGSGYSAQEQISLSSIKKSVVNIMCESTIDGELSGGSGTVMSTDGTILTASHIFPQDEDTVFVDPDEGCLVMLPNEYTGEIEEMYWAEPIIIPGLSDLYDVAFMNITGVFEDEDGLVYGTYPKIFHSFWDSEKYDEICTDDKLTINLGDNVRVLGYPTTSGGMSLTITEGIISALNDDGKLLTTAKIDSGNSGGIAVADDGCIIGMPIAVREGDYENLGAIIPGDQITEFFDMLDIYLD
ncbi:MAG: trypsin-like peptidase domain-containing protein [Candidatus Pacebacteria bacterium]|nr:trypsin-like peptidase domain-containing protein [Candidatus Paceibacterota bacterium]